MTETNRFSLVSKITIIPMAAILLGVILGSVSAGKMDITGIKELEGYFDNFFGQVGTGDLNLFLSSFKKYFVVWLLVFSSGLVVPGFLINIFTLCRRGYIIGYTSGCFCRIYGLKGVLACMGLVPEMLIFIPVLAVFSSISLKMSFFAHENKKLFFRKYFLISLIFLSVFCAVSGFQTFLTTTFMSLISRVL